MDLSYRWDRSMTGPPRSIIHNFWGGLLPVIVGVMLARFGRMVQRVAMMAMCDVRVVPGLFVVAGFVVLRCHAVMPRGVLVMFRGFRVVVGNLLGHMVHPFVLVWISCT